MVTMKLLSLVFVIALASALSACAASGSADIATVAPENTQSEVIPAEPEATPTPEISDVPIFEGAVDYKSTGDGTYITYNVPDTTVEIVSNFYKEQLAAQGWEQINKKDTGFGESITIMRSKPEMNVSVTINTNVVNKGVRVLITLIPK